MGLATLPQAGNLRIPQPRDLFEGPDSAEQYKALLGDIKNSMTKSRYQASQGDIFFAEGVGIVKSKQSQAHDFLGSLDNETLMKLGANPDLVKAQWDIGSPIATTPIQYEGTTPYGLESELLWIVPLELQLRNNTPRQKQEGQGIAYRRVTSVSNSGGATGVQSPFFSSTATSASVNGVTFNIPPLTSQTGDTTFKPFVEQGMSTGVTMRDYYMSQGFTDAQAVAMLALLWADMLGEERAMLNARSTALNVASSTATAAADTTNTTSGLPSGTATAVYVTFSSSWTPTGSATLGESKAITATGTPTTSAGEGIKLSALANVPEGALALNIYVNYSGTFYKGTTSLLVAGALGTGASPATFATVAALPSTSADNGSYDALGYDGMITEYSNPALSGYQLTLNAALNSSTPGTEFTTALSTMYTQQGADPDVIFTTGSIAKTLFDLLQTGNSTNGYRVNLVAGERGVTMGGSVTGIVNPDTSKVVDIKVHRYCPTGVAAIHSWNVPWANSNVSSCMKVVNCLDTMVVDWPQVSMSYLRSTYRIGTLIFEAPVLGGIITSIQD